MSYYPGESERMIFDRYIERNEINDDKAIREEWYEFLDELADREREDG